MTTIKVLNDLQIRLYNEYWDYSWNRNYDYLSGLKIAIGILQDTIDEIEGKK